MLLGKLDNALFGIKFSKRVLSKLSSIYGKFQVIYCLNFLLLSHLYNNLYRYFRNSILIRAHIHLG